MHCKTEWKAMQNPTDANHMQVKKKKRKKENQSVQQKSSKPAEGALSELAQ